MTLPAQFAKRIGRMKASEIRELLKLLDQPGMLSFAGGIPDPALFPAEAFAEAFQSALTPEHQAQALQYSISEGYLPLRQWIAAHMAEMGVTCASENVLITSGSQQALDYLGKLFLNPGDIAGINAPHNENLPVSVEIVPDSSLQPGDVKIESEQGSIDATLASRLQNLSAVVRDKLSELN